ncbi:TIGR02234 family membrane protein [Actinomadura rubrisoli]|uniref:TIGR02234 family membrane protein n=1 Tax=Actinomadura rubrisoli TaxID=2530368 RepID=A0A4R5BDX1_9ACTN|nr:TIGR02234 family membrane protein [Actinomadura rubrisoli]TDD83020.1 TIGR02234 family membrane protein [Actinomadura rubrisoli]
MTPGRERGLTALLCAAGSGLALLAAGRTWVTVRAGDAITPVAQSVSGRDLGGTASALALAGLAGLAALFATSGRVRAAVGALIALFGGGIAYASALAVQRSQVRSAVADKSTLFSLNPHPAMDVNLWWMVSVTGGVVLAAGGLITLVRGARWPGMSARYDRGTPAASGEDRTDAEPIPDEPAPSDVDPAVLWRSFDRGEDPTASRDGRP